MTDTTLYLVQYGRPGFVGWYASSSPLNRGNRVVIRSPRGVECGEVLAPRRLGSSAAAKPEGEVLRLATAGDLAELDHLDVAAQRVLAAVQASADELGLPLAFVDVEATLDRTAVLHILPWAPCEISTLLDRAALEHGITIRLHDLSRSVPEAEKGGCGEAGCGSKSGGCSTCGTGGGCSSGSCSKGSVKTSEELSSYFVSLREKMEAAGMTRTPLN
jgi:hypothetical protein